MNEGVNAETMVNKAKKDMPNSSTFRWLQKVSKEVMAMSCGPSALTPKYHPPVLLEGESRQTVEPCQDWHSLECWFDLLTVKA